MNTLLLTLATVAPSPPTSPASPEAGSGPGSMYVLAAMIAFFLGWRVSLRLHPWRNCKTCDGQPREYGRVFTRSFALCGTCGGSGRQLRWGAKDPASS